MVACSKRMPKCCVTGMHTISCVTHTKASSTRSVVWLTTINVVESVNKVQV